METAVSSLELMGADEIAIRLAPVLEDLNAEAAFLGGPYVRALRNKDPREDDELVVLVVAQISGNSLERSKAIRPAMKEALAGTSLHPSILAITPDEAQQSGGSERVAADVLVDWEQIHGG